MKPLVSAICLSVLLSTSAYAQFDFSRPIDDAVRNMQRQIMRAELAGQYESAKATILAQQFDRITFETKLRAAYIDATEKELREHYVVLAAWRPPEGFFRKVAEKKIAAIWDRDDIKEQRRRYEEANVALFEKSRAEALSRLAAQYQSELQKLP